MYRILSETVAYTLCESFKFTSKLFINMFWAFQVLKPMRAFNGSMVLHWMDLSRFFLIISTNLYIYLCNYGLWINS